MGSVCYSTELITWPPAQSLTATAAEKEGPVMSLNTWKKGMHVFFFFAFCVLGERGLQVGNGGLLNTKIQL